MNITDPPVRVRRLDTDRQDVLAFEACGRLDVADVENIYGLLEGACQLHPKIDVLLRIRDYEGIDWTAIARDWTLLGRNRAIRHIRRYAVVGGPGWIGATIGLFKPFFSLEMRHFDAAEEGAAWEWIGAREIPEHI
ncbi:MAG TPA: STAS/SEC14 domain-containing protein [Rhizobiaceae bacterium]|nr:STAS/SEC14 domain-containing protein [Rhizobiaceae bacterium]